MKIKKKLVPAKKAVKATINSKKKSKSAPKSNIIGAMSTEKNEFVDLLEGKVKGFIEKAPMPEEFYSIDIVYNKDHDTEPQLIVFLNDKDHILVNKDVPDDKLLVLIKKTFKAYKKSIKPFHIKVVNANYNPLPLSDDNGEGRKNKFEGLTKTILAALISVREGIPTKEAAKLLENVDVSRWLSICSAISFMFEIWMKEAKLLPEKNKTKDKKPKKALGKLSKISKTALEDLEPVSTLKM